jgi:Flp pilus assembly pilin Flp
MGYSHLAPFRNAAGERAGNVRELRVRRKSEMTARTLNALFDLYRDEEGASLVEYILLAVLIGVAAIAGMSFLGKTTNNRMNNIATAVG